MNFDEEFLGKYWRDDSKQTTELQWLDQ